MIALVALSATAAGLGVVGVVRSLGTGPAPERAPCTWMGRWRGMTAGTVTGVASGSRPHRSVRRGRAIGPALLALAVGVVAAVVTGWPVLFVLGALAGYGIPRLYRAEAVGGATAKTEAIATWTELLQGTLAASAGLVQAITNTAPLAPEPLRDAAVELAAHLRAGSPVDEALRSFAARVEDPAADRVVCALILAATSRAERLGSLLESLAASTRDDAALRLRIDAGRSAVTNAVRTVIVFTVGFGAVLTIVAHAYLSPYGTVAGQCVLLAIGATYAVAMGAMVAIARPAPPVRLLGPPDVRTGR